MCDFVCVCVAGQELHASDLAGLVWLRVHSKFNSIEIYGGWTHKNTHEKICSARVLSTMPKVERESERERGMGIREGVLIR